MKNKRRMINHHFIKIFFKELNLNMKNQSVNLVTKLVAIGNCCIKLFKILLQYQS